MIIIDTHCNKTSTPSALSLDLFSFTTNLGLAEETTIHTIPHTNLLFLPLEPVLWLPVPTSLPKPQ